jgi:pyruvate/2-oxoglutarate dehydrogenase complex dihydrolipoamide dehydrogenase (E3) component
MPRISPAALATTGSQSQAQSLTVDMRKVKARKDYVLGFSNRGVERRLRSNPMITVYQGHARLTSRQSVEVGGEVLSAPRIFINVGGRAAVPHIPTLDQVDYFTNSTLLDIEFLPPHLIVVGGSYVGLEFTPIYRRFGSEVTVIEMAPRLVPREDEDVSAAVACILGAEGIALHLGASDLRLAKRGNDIVASFDADGRKEVAGSHLLIAVGRRPNTDDLGLDTAGVALDKRGFIEVDLMYANAPYTVMQRAVHIHPTVSELLPTMLGDLKPL